VQDRDGKSLARGEQQVYDNLNRKAKKRSLSTHERDVIMSRLIGVTDADPFGSAHLARADMVIEAVYEDLAVKHKVRHSRRCAAVCLSACLSACLCVCVSVCLPVCVSISMPLCAFVCRCVR
jgi:hypothetical protein